MWDMLGRLMGLTQREEERGDTIDSVCLSDVCERGIEGQSFVDGYSH